jgi:hypothetical protein
MKPTKRLFCLAVAALSVLVCVGPATATAAQFTASGSGISISGGQTTTHVLSIGGAEMTCETVTLSGETEGSVYGSQAVHPTYEGCTMFGFIGPTVDTTGCEYVFDAATVGGEAGLALENCSNGYIEIEVESIFNTHCRVRFGDYDSGLEEGVNRAINGISYADNGGTVTAIVGATNIYAVADISTGFCPIAAGTYTDAEYSGSTILAPASGSFGWDA